MANDSGYLRVTSEAVEKSCEDDDLAARKTHGVGGGVPYQHHLPIQALKVLCRRLQTPNLPGLPALLNPSVIQDLVLAAPSHLLPPFPFFIPV